MKKAVFTIVHNEKYFLPLWLRYYKQFFNNADVYVLDDKTSDRSTDNLDVNVVPVNNDAGFHHKALARIVGISKKNYLVGMRLCYSQR